MTLNKFKNENFTYFELYVSCPICHDRGLNTPHSYWIHYNCGGSIYIGDDAHYQCESCGMNGHVFNWMYTTCPTHSKGEDLESLRWSSVDVGVAVSTAGQMVSEVGLPWLQAFLSNMGEFQNKKD